MTVTQFINEATSWLKRAIVLLALVFLALTMLRLYGFSLYPVASIDWQALGIFLAGTAYALRNL